MNKTLKIIGYAALVGMLSFSGCKKPESGLASGQAGLSAVVVFSVGESVIHHADATEEKAALGSVLNPGDKIKTGENAKVDIQFNDGSSIRLTAMADLDIANMKKSDNGATDTKLALVSGKVFAKVNKKQKDDNFSIVTPTAIAGVRGTSFVMEYGKDNKANVKVIEGAVSLAPRVQALEGVKQEEINKDEKLVELQKAAEDAEVVIQPNQQSSIVAEDKAIGNVDDKSDLNDKAKVQAAIDKMKKAEKPKVAAAAVTKNEEQEVNTMVTVDQADANKMVELKKESQNAEPEKLAEIEKEKKALEEKVVQKQEKAKDEFLHSIAAQPKELKSKKDIVKYYERIEQIIMADGSKVVGAIVDQKGNFMIVHTEKGIQKINQNDVQEVIYDFQTKMKF